MDGKRAPKQGDDPGRRTPEQSNSYGRGRRRRGLVEVDGKEREDFQLEGHSVPWAPTHKRGWRFLPHETGDSSKYKTKNLYICFCDCIHVAAGILSHVGIQH